MVTVPCDTPAFPGDLVARLAEALRREGAEIAMAATIEDGRVQTQPVFCLVDALLLESLADCLKSGERKIDRWTVGDRGRVLPLAYPDRSLPSTHRCDDRRGATAPRTWC